MHVTHSTPLSALARKHLELQRDNDQDTPRATGPILRGTWARYWNSQTGPTRDSPTSLLPTDKIPDTGVIVDSVTQLGLIQLDTTTGGTKRLIDRAIHLDLDSRSGARLGP